MRGCLNSAKLLAELPDLAAVRIVVPRPGRIVIEVLASDVRRLARLDRAWARLTQGDSLFIGSVSHGGGVMSHTLHRGFAQAGIDCVMCFANEIRPELLDHAVRVNDAWESDTVALAAPLQEIAFDQVAELPMVDVLEAGLPCSGASVSGRAKRGLALAEAHPQVSHLVAGFLALIVRVYPVVIVIENVVPYLSSGSAWILRNQLADWGYEVQELVFRGSEFNALEDRERAVLVAVTHGIEFDLGALDRPARQRLRLGDILDDIPPASSRWSPVTGLKTKQVRDEAEGKGSGCKSRPRSQSVRSRRVMRRYAAPTRRSAIRTIRICCGS